MSDDTRHNEHENGHDVGNQVEQRDLLEGDPRDVRRKNVERAEHDRAEYRERRFPERENDERNGEPADALNEIGRASCRERV